MCVNFVQSLIIATFLYYNTRYVYDRIYCVVGQKRAISVEVDMVESVLQNVEHQLRVNARARLLQVSNPSLEIFSTFYSKFHQRPQVRYKDMFVI